MNTETGLTTTTDAPLMQPNVFLIARSPAEMRTTQAKLEAWMQGKVAAEEKELDTLMVCLSHATDAKQKVTGLRSAVTRQEKRVTYYSKCLEAVRLGYALVPEFPIDVFAVRVGDGYPCQQSGTNYRPSRWVPDSTGEELQPGEGRNVSANKHEVSQHQTTEKLNGKEVTRFFARANDYCDVEFPMVLANPALLNAVQEALSAKLFDEIGICPATRRRGDPMVIGRIHTKRGYQTRSMNFIIAWWIDTATL